MKLKENHYYLIDISFCGYKIKVVKYLGISSNRNLDAKYKSFACIDFTPNFPHNGITENGNHGELGKCIYLHDRDFKALKELSKEEVMVEML